VQVAKDCNACAFVPDRWASVLDAIVGAAFTRVEMGLSPLIPSLPAGDKVWMNGARLKSEVTCSTTIVLNLFWFSW
jgi:hypothetical protein